MKDSKLIRKILYTSTNEVALVVLNNVNNENNILFASQVSIKPADLQVKVNELLTNAANFLGFNIKDVELIINDPNISRQKIENEVFIGCVSEEDIVKEIYKKAKIDNYFINEINFYGIEFDEIDKTAKVNGQTCASNYITYRSFVDAVQACHVLITNTTNIYKLLKSNKEQIELTIKIDNNQAIACEYYGGKLNNVKVIDIKMNEIAQHIADRYAINPAKMDNVLTILNDLLKSDDLDIDIVNNYDLKTKTYKSSKVQDLLALYRDEIRTQINNFVDFRNFQYIRIISDSPVNNIDGFECFSNNEICLDDISLDKIVCLSNIDANKNELSQFGFEHKINSINLFA